MPRLPIKHNFLFKLKYNNITRSNYIFRTYDIDSRYYSIMNTIFVHVLPRPHWRFLLLNPSLSCGFSPNGCSSASNCWTQGDELPLHNHPRPHTNPHIFLCCVHPPPETHFQIGRCTERSNIVRRADMYIEWVSCQYILGAQFSETAPRTYK